MTRSCNTLVALWLGTALAASLGSGCAPKRVVGEPETADRQPTRYTPPVPPVRVRKPGKQDVVARVEPETQRPAARSEPSLEAPLGTRRSASTDRGREAAALARAQLGKPYQWGGAGPDRFDCSGLVHYVFRQLGVSLPRVSGRQASAGVHIDRRDLRPGDLVFFVLSGSSINHVGIYLGRGEFVHAPRRHLPVRTDSLNDVWWSRRFKGGRRVLSAQS